MATLTVGPSGTYPTIADALLAASPGDTIVLQSGYSNEAVTVTVENITITGDVSSTGIVLTMGTGVTGLTAGGLAPINITDNAGGNIITGSAGDNVITVTQGIDVVDGGLGSDRLVVDYQTGGVVTGALTGFTAADGRSVSMTGVEHVTVYSGGGIDNITTGAGDDYIYGGNGANTIIAGGGNNIVETGDGVDTITTGSGNDIIRAGDGASTIAAGGGDNIIINGSGIDTITFGDGTNIVNVGAGASTVTGGDGNNIVVGGLEAGIGTITLGTGDNIVHMGDGANTIALGATGTGNNTVTTGSGVDTITVGGGDNFICAGDGANTITAGPTFAGDNIIIGGSGLDTITTGNGDNIIQAGDGANTIAAGSGNNIISAGSGIDTIVAMGGNNRIEAGDGANTITTGAGNDTIHGGTGIDTITTGAGSDYIYADTGGADVIVAGDSAGDIDVLDVRFLGIEGVDYRINYSADPQVGTIDRLGAGGVTTSSFSFAGIESIIVGTDPVTAIPILHCPTAPFACFTPGTMIDTADGRVAVENLTVGCMVLTRDHGHQPIRWIGSKQLDAATLRNNPALQPILIGQGALGRNEPDRDMMVSRQHRMLVSGWRVELLFGCGDALVKAAHLLGLAGVKAAELATVTYVHIMFDHHEVVLADGAWSESFQPGEHGLSGLDTGQRDELFTVFPELRSSADIVQFDAAFQTLKAYEARVLFAA